MSSQHILVHAFVRNLIVYAFPVGEANPCDAPVVDSVDLLLPWHDLLPHCLWILSTLAHEPDGD